MNISPFNLDFDAYVNQPLHHIQKSPTVDLSEALESDNNVVSDFSISQERVIESEIRYVFNRPSQSFYMIGQHPDFDCLANTTDTKKQYICPLFIDIKDSTRLGIKYDLEFVKKFKNAVIIASKLQSLAKKNTCMLGQGLLDMMNFPHDFCKYKDKDKPQKEKMLYVTPNYTNGKNKKINYKMRIFDIDKYLKGIYIDTNIKAAYFPYDDIVYSPKFLMKVEILKDNTATQLTTNMVIQKKSKIRMTISITDKALTGEKFKVYFHKINHKGHNNEDFFRKEFGTPKMLREFFAEEINLSSGKNSVEFIRDCSYRGIHRIECEIKDQNKRVVFKDYINVPIE